MRECKMRRLVVVWLVQKHVMAIARAWREPRERHPSCHTQNIQLGVMINGCTVDGWMNV